MVPLPIPCRPRTRPADSTVPVVNIDVPNSEVQGLKPEEVARQ